MQVVISQSLNTIQVEIWHEYQACQITSKRNNDLFTRNTLNTCEDQVLLIQRSGDRVWSFLNELNIALLYLLAIFINVEVTCLSVRNVVLIRSSSCIRTSSSSWTLRTLRPLRPLRPLRTSVALFANSLVIRLFAILHPEAIVTDSPSSTRSTINTISTILNVERLTVAQCYSNTVSSF